jgi:4'-phosphopantetheinyl transferase
MILPPPIWSKAPAHPVLPPGEIQLWRACLTDSARLASSLATLSAEERQRAERFVFPRDRLAYVLAHGALREVLARYLRTAPEDLEFTVGAQGKPRIVQTFTDLRFNLSHSDGLALIAVTRGREVGVDVERVVDDILFEEIARAYFEPQEVWDLRIAPPHERVLRFFELWTRKEASLKASGLGLPGLGELRNNPRFATRNLALPDGYAGAVACEGNDWRLACWDWSQ